MDIFKYFNFRTGEYNQVEVIEQTSKNKIPEFLEESDDEEKKIMSEKIKEYIRLRTIQITEEKLRNLSRFVIKTLEEKQKKQKITVNLEII